MKNLKDIVSERLHINKNTKGYNYYPKDEVELDKLIQELIKERGNNADLNDIDTSKIKNMDDLFAESNFDGDISQWNVSNVESMESMFSNSKYTGQHGGIANWDVSKVKIMSRMFENSSFNSDISNWDVSNVEDMFNMFFYCKNFDQNLDKWNPKSLKGYKGTMFIGCPLQYNPPKWYKNIHKINY